MKYTCSHCGHKFELEDRDFQRCPNCFWTTSLVPAGEAAQNTKSHTTSQPKTKRKLNLKLLFVLVLFLSLLGGVVGFLIYKKPNLPELSFKMPSLPKLSLPKSEPKSEMPKMEIVPPKEQSDSKLISFLNEKEKENILKPIQLQIPRKLNSDEEEILKKQVSLPSNNVEKPKLTAWSKEEFEKNIQAEQKKRKVYFGWAYERSLTKNFEKNYPLGIKVYEEGDFVLARDYFLKSLAFPVFKNDVKKHRAVALVILRPFINDVIGKIAILNQHLLKERLLTDLSSLIQSYEALFSTLKAQDWKLTLEKISDLKKQIETFENKPTQEQINYGSSFNALDPELQMAIQMEASPKLEAAVSLKALLVDLNLKEKVTLQNTPEALGKVQKELEEISRLLQAGELDNARTKLRGIEFPPELVEEARAKIALIDQAEALRASKQQKGN